MSSGGEWVPKRVDGEYHIARLQYARAHRTTITQKHTVDGKGKPLEMRGRDESSWEKLLWSRRVRFICKFHVVTISCQISFKRVGIVIFSGWSAPPVNWFLFSKTQKFKFIQFRGFLKMINYWKLSRVLCCVLFNIPEIFQFSPIKL